MALRDRRRVPLRRHAVDALLGLALTAASLALLEGLLALLGVAAPAPEDLSRGFDPRGQYLVADPALPGGWVTQFAARAGEREVHVPPRGEAPRVLLFGGSNTRGFPEEHLARQLERRLGRPVEVVNLGRSGYGSERVAIVFAQALERLEPDAVVLYTGHNEFVELGFGWDLERAWGTRRPGGLVARAQRTRLVGALRSLVGEPAGGRVARPAAWRAERQKFAGVHYAETLARYDAYEERLEGMARSARERGVRVVLCTVVYNRFSPPDVSTLPGDLTPEDRQAIEEALARAWAAYPAFLRAVAQPEARERLGPWDWVPTGAAPLPGGERQGPLPGLRPAVGPLADARPRFPERQPWSGRVRPFYAALAELHAGVGEDADLRGRLEGAAAALEEVLERCPDHPRALYERALVAYALGDRGPSVQRGLEDAVRFDRAPSRGNREQNGRVRRVAARVPGAELFDADALFVAGTPGGLVGWEFLQDHCHLSPGGKRLLLERLAEHLAAGDL